MRLLRLGLISFVSLLIFFSTSSILAQAPGDCVIDAVMLIDTAASLAPEDFEQIKAFASAAVGGLPMGGVRLGVIGFDQTAQSQVGLTGDGGAVMGAIGSLSITSGAADFRIGLEAAAAMLTDVRPYVSRAIILITDGFSATNAARRAELIRADNIAIITVGIGRGINQRELYNLATPSGERFVIFQPQFDRLGTSVGSVTRSLCSASSVIGGTVNARTRDDRGYPITLPVNGVNVTLLNQSNEPIATTRTGESGFFRFFVAPGIYNVQVELPPGARYAPSNDGYFPLIQVRLASTNTRASTLMEINF